MSDEKLQSELKRLSGEASFAHYLSLCRPQSQVFATIGLYSQLAATMDLHLRRIYFALLAEGKNERGSERAHLDQIIERLPAAIEKCGLDLYRRAEFPELLTVLRELLKSRNDVIHSACRWQPDGDVLIFAHVNEKAGRNIKTGDKVAYWLIRTSDFRANVRGLEKMAGYVSQYAYSWLPKLRPWLENYWNGEPDPAGSAAEAFFSEAIPQK